MVIGKRIPNEVIKMFNDKTQEVIEQGFDKLIDADKFEYHLDLLQIHYQRYSGGELLYEENKPEG